MPLPRWLHNPPKVRRRPPGLTRLLYLGVVFTFAPIGSVVLMAGNEPPGWIVGVISMALAGVISIAWTFTISSGRYYLFVLVLPLTFLLHRIVFAHMLAHVRVGGTRLLELGLHEHAGTRQSYLALMSLVSLVIGYSLTVRLTRRWERMSARERAELEVAERVHRSLVPDVDVRACGARIVGRSVPSSEMGGDLIDVVVRDGAADVFLADVSGHGVGAGIVMGMVKSSIRTTLVGESSLDEVLSRVNRVLVELTRSDMFATLACVRVHADGRVEHALAGHLSILCVRAGGAVEEFENQSLPLGIDEGERFVVGSSRMSAGDTLVLYTDGLIEVPGVDGTLLGLARFREIVLAHARGEIDRAIDAIVSEVRAFGPGRDDQSLVLVRML